MTRLEIILERRGRLRDSAINPDMRSVLDAYDVVENLKCKLRFAESALDNAVRGLEHKDYDLIFEGWARK